MPKKGKLRTGKRGGKYRIVKGRKVYQPKKHTARDRWLNKWDMPQ